MAALEPVERALDVALLVMENGGSTTATHRSFTNVLEGHGGVRVAAVWRLDFVAVTGEAEGQPVVWGRPVGSIGVNLARASAATALAERVARGEVELASLAPAVERIRALPSPYNRWQMAAAAAFAAACFSQLLGGDWGSLGIAFVAAGLGQALRSLLQQRHVGAAAATLVCGLLSASLASVGLRLGLSRVTPASLMAAVIYLVPGLALINGFLDVVSHRHLMLGLERIANAGYLFVLLIVASALPRVLLL